ncbi:hypothetical protein E6C55_25300 [Cohnella fermenti]|uniref:ArpU family transcriptional regulator n=1 Tax=Cohnella fermenti TaxID=2565925 RepID=A0A4S4BJ34_9BACL|nr:hypothetical protein E6C55_25300 [Cohnella fermenti]
MTDLPEWRTRLETLKVELSHIPGLAQRFEQVAIYGKGQKNEAILNEVIRRLQAKEIEIPFLQLKIEILQKAIGVLPPEERQFVEDKYEHKLATPFLLERLDMPPRSFYRLRRRALERVYRMVGGKDSVLWLDDRFFSGDER